MTIDTNELRMLAQAALIGPDGVSMRWLKLLKDFQEEANPAAVLEILDRLEAAESDALEQARLSGMGAERELVLLAKIDRLRRALIAMTKGYKSVPYAQWAPEMHFAAEVLEETK